MRNYLFIDLHIHSKYSFENDCDATPEEILHNALETAKVVQRAMIERVEQCENSENASRMDDLIREFSPYFADRKEEQEHIQEILLNSPNKVQQLKDYIINDTKCCISITDHQNIQGSKDAISLIKKHPAQYKQLDFIPGIEVNAGLRCIGVNEDGYSSFKKCHALAYGYNVYDPTFNSFSKLFNYKLNNISDSSSSTTPIEIGKMILWAKKRVDDITGKKIPIADLDFITNNTRSCLHAQNKFFCYLKEHYPKKNFRNIPEIMQCFNFSKFGNEQAISGSKWELDDYMNAIKNADGYFALAHPYSINKKQLQNSLDCNNAFAEALISTTQDNAFQIFKNTSIIDKNVIDTKVISINALYNKHYSAEEIYQLYITFTFGKNIEEFVQKVIQLRGDNNFGFEIFNKLNLSGAKSKVLYDIAKKYDLYLSGGSDHHGVHLHSSNIISRCFDKKFIYDKSDLFAVDENRLQQEMNKANSVGVDNTLTYMPFVGLIKNKHKYKEKQKISFYNRQNGTMELNDSLFDRHKTWVIKPGRSAQEIKNYLDTTGVDHISRKNFAFLKNDENTKSVSSDGGIEIV